MSTLNLRIQVEVPGLDGLEEVNAQVNQVEESTGKLGATGQGVFQGIGQEVARFGIGLAQAGIDAGIQAIGDSIGLASDKAEAASKVNVLYGDSADTIHEASERAAETVGMSSGAYLEAAGTLGNLLTNFDIAQPAAAAMSEEMLQLAADVGSFNNADPSEVVEAMGAAFRGESEPIRRFGVMLDEASVKAKAMELGLYSGVGALESSARAQATYALILEDTAAAQGDFARTADGLANSQRIANAQIEDALTSVGEKLMPVVADLVPLLADGLVGAIDLVSGALDALGPLLEGIGWVLERTGDFVEALSDDLNNLAGTMDMGDARAEFETLGRAAGLTAEEIDAGWAQIEAATRGGALATETDMGTVVDAYAATAIEARVAAQGAELAADRAVANATRWASSADRIADAYATAGQRLPAIARQAADDANMADALADRTQEAMPEAARRIGHAMHRELNAQAVRGQALEAARAIGSAVPGEIADGMVAKSREVLDAGDRLIDLLKNGLTPEEQAMRLIGEKYTRAVAQGVRSEIPGAREAALQLAVTSINTVEDAGLSGARGARGMEAIGRYYDQLLAGGMTAAEARVALAAGGVANATIDALEGKANAFENAGQRVGGSWVDGFAASVRGGRAIIDRAVRTATAATHGMSPPKVGPLRHIDDWGWNVGAAWAEGFAGGMGQVVPLMDTAARFGDVAPPGLGSSSGGGLTGGGVQVVINTGVGDPVAIGREVVDAIQAYERSSGRAWREES